MNVETNINMTKLREALEASWRPDTAYHYVEEAGNPALGQCYPTSRVVQFYFPETEIVEGEVLTPKGAEKHFWNLLISNGAEYHIDFSWRQFPEGSSVKGYKVRDRESLGDSPETIARVNLLMERVKERLAE